MRSVIFLVFRIGLPEGSLLLGSTDEEDGFSSVENTELVNELRGKV